MTLLDDIENERNAKRKAKEDADKATADAAQAKVDEDKKAAELAAEKRQRDIAREEAKKLLDEEMPIIEDAPKKKAE